MFCCDYIFTIKFLCLHKIIDYVANKNIAKLFYCLKKLFLYTAFLYLGK